MVHFILMGSKILGTVNSLHGRKCREYTIPIDTFWWRFQLDYLFCRFHISDFSHHHHRMSSLLLLHRSYGMVCMLARSMCLHAYVHPYLHPSWNILCSANKRLDLETPILANICTLIMYVRLPIFIRIINILDLHFKGQRFESSTLRRLHVIISQLATDRTKIAVANK